MAAVQTGGEVEKETMLLTIAVLLPAITLAAGKNKQQAGPGRR